MKPIPTLVFTAVAALALAGSAVAAPQDVDFTVPVSVDINGLSDSGGPITEWEVECQLQDASDHFLARGISASSTSKTAHKVVKLVAAPMPYWQQNPKAVPVKWICRLPLKSAGDKEFMTGTALILTGAGPGTLTATGPYPQP